MNAKMAAVDLCHLTDVEGVFVQRQQVSITAVD